MSRRSAWVEAAGVVVFVLGLFAYWFGIADRYAIFLYGHSAPGLSIAEPFDDVTASRYWMAGLVATGFVLVWLPLALWSAGRLMLIDRPPVWWRAWSLSALPLALGIPAITLTVNTPTLPFELTAACVLSTLVGLAIALFLAERIAERPSELLWLIADAIGLVPPLLLLRAIELPARGLSVTPVVAWSAAIGGTLGGALWLLMVSLAQRARGREPSGGGTVFAAGLGLSYLILPVVHHLLATPAEYRYISTAGNFFAFDRGVQVTAIVVAGILAWAATALRSHWRRAGRATPRS